MVQLTDNGLKLKKSSCRCVTCKAMCASSPCWPTPEEARRLQAEHPDKVVYDTSYWLDSTPVKVLSPAAVGEVAGGVYSGYRGPCVFFKDGKCELHYTDLKPLEGRLATHEYTGDQVAELRRHVGRMWAREAGLDA